MRSTLYDTVSDRYARFLRDEVLSDVGAKYNIRKDATAMPSRASRQAGFARSTRRGRCLKSSAG